MPVAGSSTAWSQNANGDLALSLGLVVLCLLRTPLRLIGALRIAAAGVLMLRAPQPDVLVAAEGGAVAVRGRDDVMAVAYLDPVVAAVGAQGDLIGAAAQRDLVVVAAQRDGIVAVAQNNRVVIRVRAGYVDFAALAVDPVVVAAEPHECIAVSEMYVGMTTRPAEHPVMLPCFLAVISIVAGAVVVSRGLHASLLCEA